MEKIKLVDVISSLRRELYAANEAGKSEDLKLEIQAIDVEFEVEIEKRGEAGVEVEFNVLVVGGKVKAGGDIHSAHTHRIKLHLTSTLNGERTQIGGAGKRESD